MPMHRQCLPFASVEPGYTALCWMGRFGPQHEFNSPHIVFTDAELDSAGRWCVPIATLNTFADTMIVPNCPMISMPLFPWGESYECAAHRGHKSCFFCDSPLPLQCMCKHVTGHL